MAPNETETGDPRTDEEIKGYVTRYFASLPASPPWETWHMQRISGAMDEAEQQAAQKAAAHANTPTVAYFDTLGRPFLTVIHNRFPKRQTDGSTVIINEYYPTRVELDIEGNQRSVTDALDRVVMRYDYDMLGNRIHQASMEAGERWMLNNVAGKPLRRWDSRGHTFSWRYDPLQRPTHNFVQRTGGAEILVERLVYGEAHPDTDRNLRGQLYQHYDSAGVVTNERFDFKGNSLGGSRQLASEYKVAVDWSVLEALTNFSEIANAAAPSLESEIFACRTKYDALNRPVMLITPHHGTVLPNVIQPRYNEGNLLEKVHLWLRQSSAPNDLLDPDTADQNPVVNLDYNAKGQRTLIEYGNGARTEYDYDPFTFRLRKLLTIRSSSTQLQDLNYWYDPAGNITTMRDEAQDVISWNGQQVEPRNEYVYDALYRLFEAKGREHAGQNAPAQRDHREFVPVNSPHPNQPEAMRNYTENYDYDSVGNILKMIHVATNASWTRHYGYAEPSLIEPSRFNNRLSNTSLPGDNPLGPYSAKYNCDEHGNMTAMPHLSVMAWDYRDQLQMTRRQQVNDDDVPGQQHDGEHTYYVYDAAGQRVCKVTENGNSSKRSERIYLGGFEIYREYNGVVASPKLERETLHVMDDKQRVALVETNTRDSGSQISNPKSLIRYQLANHLGSATMELADQAQVISYEEYHPYGTTSYQEVDHLIQAAAKRYRYTAKERDEETGLYYYGARFYACWLGRWTSADPAGSVDGPNLYGYVRGGPIRFHDPTGNDPKDDLPDYGLEFMQRSSVVLAVSLGIKPPTAEEQKAQSTALAAERKAQQISPPPTVPRPTNEKLRDKTPVLPFFLREPFSSAPWSQYVRAYQAPPEGAPVGLAELKQLNSGFPLAVANFSRDQYPGTSVENLTLLTVSALTAAGDALGAAGTLRAQGAAQAERLAQKTIETEMAAQKAMANAAPGASLLKT